VKNDFLPFVGESCYIYNLSNTSKDINPVALRPEINYSHQ